MTRFILAAALLLSACGPNTDTGPRVDLPDGPGLGGMPSAAIDSLPKPIPSNMGPGSGGAPDVTGRGPVRTPLQSLLVRAIPESGRY